MATAPISQPTAASPPAQTPGQKLSAEQQKAYDMIVKQAMAFLLEGEHAKTIVDKASTGDPKAAVVDACMPLINSIYTAASQAGAKVDMVTILAASIEIIANISDMLATVGVIEKKDVPQFAAEVGKMAVAQHNASVQGGA